MTMSMQRLTMLICSCLMFFSLAVQADDMKKDGMMDKTTTSTTTMDNSGTMDKAKMEDATDDMKEEASDKMKDEAEGTMMENKDKMDKKM